MGASHTTEWNDFQARCTDARQERNQFRIRLIDTSLVLHLLSERQFVCELRNDFQTRVQANVNF